jgi:hypothetical protein
MTTPGRIVGSGNRGRLSRPRFLLRGSSPGNALLHAKAAVGHGSWLEWLRENVRCKRETAWRWMRLAEQSKCCNLQHLTPEEAFRWLADEPSSQPPETLAYPVESGPGPTAGLPGWPGTCPRRGRAAPAAPRRAGPRRHAMTTPAGSSALEKPVPNANRLFLRPSLVRVPNR